MKVVAVLIQLGNAGRVSSLQGFCGLEQWRWPNCSQNPGVSGLRD